MTFFLVGEQKTKAMIPLICRKKRCGKGGGGCHQMKHFGSQNLTKMYDSGVGGNLLKGRGGGRSRSRLTQQHAKSCKLIDRIIHVECEGG